MDRPNGPIIAAACGPDGAIRAVQECSTHTRNTTKLTTRGGTCTSPDCAEMTVIRERKSTHRLGRSLGVPDCRALKRTTVFLTDQSATVWDEATVQCCWKPQYEIPQNGTAVALGFFMFGQLLPRNCRHGTLMPCCVFSIEWIVHKGAFLINRQ